MTESYGQGDIFASMGMGDVIEQLEKEKKSPKEVAKEKAKENKGENKKKVEPKQNKQSVVKVGNSFNVNDINSSTRVLITMASESITLGDWFPEYFKEDGVALSKIDKVEEKKSDEISLDLVIEEEKTKENKANNGKSDIVTKKTETSDAKLTPEIVRKRLAQEWPQFQSKEMVSFTIERKHNCLYAIIQAGKKGGHNHTNEPFEITSLIPEKLTKKFLLEFLNRAKEVYLTEGSEVQWDLYWDHQLSKYIWDEPIQERSIDEVNAETNYSLQMTLCDPEGSKGDSMVKLRYQFIGCVHSHHVFVPRMSTTDLSSQITFHLYGILGGFPHSRAAIEDLDVKFIDENHVTFSTYFNNQHHLIPFSEVMEND